jgi:flagellar hook-associated protein 3 FlgL
MLGETEGTDLAKAVSDLTQQQYVYEASLAASAKMLQPTLLDFLR